MTVSLTPALSRGARERWSALRATFGERLEASKQQSRASPPADGKSQAIRQADERWAPGWLDQPAQLALPDFKMVTPPRRP
jgi:hypothetical protein